MPVVLLRRYYLNGQDAYRLKLLLPVTEQAAAARAARMEAGMNLDAVATSVVQQPVVA